MSKLPKVKGFKRFLHIFSSAGASVVIAGALFKIMHWPGWDVMLVTGMLTEAVIFILFAFDIPHEEYDWTLAYPELAGMGTEHTEEEGEEGLTPTQQLDLALENAKIGPELMQSLSEGLSKLSETAKQLGDISNAQLATNEYVDNLKQAAKNVHELSDTYAKAADSMSSLANTDAGQLGESVNEVSESLNKFSKNVAALNATYELQLQSAKDSLENVNQFYGNLEELLKNITDASADTRKYKEEMSALASNLSALNTIYGNMLNAMTYKPVNQY
ncbi:MAG: gliding motility protein GldL [Bacteroidia bacterium]|nr:gliding motility protein GldL [Bacteroidia bacterium]